MNVKMTVFALACALALSACSDNTSSTAPSAAAPSAAATVATQTEAPAPVDETSAATTATNDKPAAVVADCSTVIEADDAMEYNVSSIAVPSSCTDFKITLKHVGKMPVTAMGHDVVITKASDMEAVDTDGMAAGADAGYLKADDPRVIAHTKLIGGGETTSVSFPVSKIASGGPFVFFCSFPGHSTRMHGPISVE